MSQSTIFQLCRDKSSWVQQVLSRDKCVLLKDTAVNGYPQPLNLESSTLLLSLFFSFSHFKCVGAIDPRGVVIGLIRRIYVRDHQILLNTKYISYEP